MKNDLRAIILENRRLCILRLITEGEGREDLRLCILRLLAALDGHEANTSIIQSALGCYGLQVTRDQIRTEGAWLVEQGAVTKEDLGKMDVLHLTTRGQEIAEGLTTLPGVAVLPTITWLRNALDKWGMKGSEADVETDVAWLEQQGLVKRDDRVVLPLLPLADDVAKGRTVITGIKRPSAGD